MAGSTRAHGCRDEGKPVPNHEASPAAVVGVVNVHVEGAVLAIVAVPRSGITGFAGLESDAIRVRVAVPPVDGSANAALIRFLAQALDVPRSQVRIVSGERGRRKRVLFVGLSQEELGQRLHTAGAVR